MLIMMVMMKVITEGSSSSGGGADGRRWGESTESEALSLLCGLRNEKGRWHLG